MGKFVVHFSGPISKYRLDLFMDSSPDIKDHVIFFTNKDSYLYYKEYHNKLEFVFIDDLRSDNETSKTFEIFPDPLFPTENEYFKNLHSFYINQEHPKFWPFETRRFIFKYLLDHNVLNFCIVNNNVVFNNNSEAIETYFDNIPPGYLYAPFHGEDPNLNYRKPIWDSLQVQFPEISLNSPFLRTCDGFLRGHHFKNKEDMLLYFNIWDACVNKVLSSNMQIGHNNIIIQLEWISSHIMQFFEYNRGYKFLEYTQLERANGKLVLKYMTKPEDKLFSESRIGGWDFYGFDYSDVSSISNFIKNNKSQLERYYSSCWGVGPFEITDTHIYSRIT